MKRTLSDADRLELKSKLFDRFPALFPDDMFGRIEISNELVQFFSEFYESKNSFSDVVRNGTREEKMCPLCDRLYIVNNRKFIRLWVLVLRALSEKPMTMTEVDAQMHSSGIIKGSAVTSTVKCGVLMRHWNLIEQTEEKRKGAHVYALTQLGRDFIDGRATIPSHVWLSPHGVDPEKPNEIARQIYVHEVADDDSEELSDRKKYVDEGESAFPA